LFNNFKLKLKAGKNMSLTIDKLNKLGQELGKKMMIDSDLSMT